MRAIFFFLIVAAFVATVALAHSDKHEDEAVFMKTYSRHVLKKGNKLRSKSGLVAFGLRWSKYRKSGSRNKYTRINKPKYPRKGLVVFRLRQKLRNFGRKVASGAKKVGKAALRAAKSPVGRAVIAKGAMMAVGAMGDK